MKLLLVDDDVQKIGKVVSFLTEVLGLPRDDVHVAHTLSDARRELMGLDFDIMILDILLPGRAGESPSQKGTVALLEELTSRRSLRKPRHILGLTAYDDAIREAGPAFRDRTWTIIKFNPESDEWKSQIENCVQYVQTSNESNGRVPYGVDLCIVTALTTPELQAVERLPWNWGAAEPLDDVTFAKVGWFMSGGSRYSVIAAAGAKTGMVAAALLTAKLIVYKRPRFIVMAGICAGVKGKANLGDVIVSDPAWDWQSGKYSGATPSSAFAIAPDALPLSNFVRVSAEQLRSDAGALAEMKARWPAEVPSNEVKIRVGPMASGSAVLANPELMQEITRQHRNLLAVEMEAYGVLAAAAYSSYPRPTAFACKSVCDFGDEEKDDAWQGYASYTSAEFVRLFFERNMERIQTLAGTR